MTGKVAPETVNPVPVSVAEFTVTEAVPVEVRVTDCVAGVFNVTLPKVMLAASTLSVGTAAINCRAKFADTPAAVAVSVTGCAVPTEVTVAVNTALVAFAPTVTAVGTVTARLLLDRFTAVPPARAAPVSVTVQESVPDPVIDALPHDRVLNVGKPVPLKPITAELPADELLAIVRLPDVAPDVVGVNPTVNVAA